MRKVTTDKDVDVSVIARSTPGFTGADLANLVNEAALLAARHNRKAVTQIDFEIAKDKVLMGPERKSMIITDEEKRATAYHEAGHALVAVKMPAADPVHKVTIIPRGRALGVTQTLPVDDRHTHSMEYIESTIAMLMGGRVAEELRLKQLTTGAANDFERATDMARKMVTEWGMSEKIGPLTFGKQEEQIFLGREIAQHRDYSESTAKEIDTEVKRIVLRGYEVAKRILTENDDVLTAIAEALLERETIEASDIEFLLKGEPLPDLPQLAAEAETDDAVAPVEKPADREPENPGVLPKPGEQPA
jgi:cell division protease FtsH